MRFGKIAFLPAILSLFLVGCSSGEDSSTTQNDEAEALQEGATMPSNHPDISQVMAKHAEQKLVHFKVGNNNVKRLLKDGDFIWLATSGGVIRYNTKSDEYRLYNHKDGFLSKGVFYIGKLDNNVVAGTYGGGLAVLDAQTDRWKNYNIPDGLADAFVYDAIKDSNGDIWIATWSGFNKVKGGNLDDPDSWEIHTVESTNGGLPNDWVYAISEGKDGTMWFATEAGLARLKDDQWTSWAHKDGLGAPYDVVKDDIEFKSNPADFSRHHAHLQAQQGLQNVIDTAFNPNYIIALDVDKDGVVWLGTWGGGLARFDGKEWINYTTKDGLPSNHAFMVYIDTVGDIWIGTSQGLAHMNKQSGGFDVMTTQNGLFSNAVFSMTDSAEAIWVGSYGGIAQIKR